MQAIIHGGKGKPSGGRGAPPKSIADKYSSPGKDAPEQSGENRGGNWDEKAHKRHAEKGKKKKDKDKVKKSFEQYYSGRGAGVIVPDSDGKILVGMGTNGKWQTPGGHVERDEDFDEGAHRELREEAGIVANKLTEVGHLKVNGNDSKVFVADSYRGNIKDSSELKDLQFVELGTLLDWDLRDCSRRSIEMYAQSSLKKSKRLKDMLVIEKLEKNIMRGGMRNNVVYDVSHGDALRLIGNGCFRFLKSAVDGMGDEEFRDILFKGYKKAINALNDDRFFVVMTGDSRDSKGAFYGCEAEHELFFKEQGLHIYNKIVYLECEFTRLAQAKVTLNFRKFPKREQKILVFYKGNIDNIKNLFSKIGRL